ncbi:MAG: hypothetical protein ACRD0P_14965, partial [Stackebrandtia sp.]
RWAQQQRDAEDWAAIQQGVRAQRRRPTFAELRQRRTAGRQDGRTDYEGGPVDYWTGQPRTDHDTESEAA